MYTLNANQFSKYFIWAISFNLTQKNYDVDTIIFLRLEVRKLYIKDK